MNDITEAYIRAEIVAEIVAAIPREIVTEWESAYVKGLKKAIQIVEGKK